MSETTESEEIPVFTDGSPDLVEQLDDLKSLGELKIETPEVPEKAKIDEPEKVVESEVAEIAKEKSLWSENASTNGSESNLVQSQRSSLPSLSGILSTFSGRGDFWSTSSTSPQVEKSSDDGPDYLGQRRNLSLVAKIATRALIDPCLEKSIIIEENYPPLVQFLTVLEEVLLHGWKQKISMFNRNKSFWAVFDHKHMELAVPELKDTNKTVKDLPAIKTGLGRARAFLRLALMQKKLPDYLDALQASDASFRAEFWEDWALLRHDEAPEIFGHMQGLSIVEANLDLKGVNLDGQVGVIDFSLVAAVTDASSNANTNQLEKENKRLLDQKSFLEERNRQLEDRLKLRTDKLDVTDETKNNLESELKAAKIMIENLQEELNSVKVGAESDSKALNESFAVQKTGFKAKTEELVGEIDDFKKRYSVLENQVKVETQERLELEKMLENEIKNKQQLELGIRMLERDAYEKQDTLEQLQKQLEDTRSINQRLFDEVREKNDRERERLRKLEESKQAISALRSENENIFTEHEKLKIQEADASDMKLRLESEIDDLKVQVLKYESDLNQETDRRKIAENEAKAAKMVAENLKTEHEGSKTLVSSLEVEVAEFKATVGDLESALTDMAAQLENAQLDRDDMKDLHESLTGHSWVDEKTVKCCAKCNRDFTLKRRKHHCRNCGNVYCGSCSSNSMPLASNPKPVRVCDNCHVLLLARLS